MKVHEVALRRSAPLGAALLVVTVTAAAVTLLLAARPDPSPWLTEADLSYLLCQLLPYGLVGAVLIARRPDLPFGWILGLAALCLAVVTVIAIPAGMSFESRPSQLALWALGLGGLAWIPAALEGVINVRFPSGRPTGRVGRVLDHALAWGIAVLAAAAVLSDWPARQAGVTGVSRFIDGSPITAVANALLFGIPVIILLGVLAGIGVVVRCWRATGLERQQLQWRAAGVLLAMAAFPFVVTESAPQWVSLVAPLIFVTTLVIPVLRYDLWAIDSIVRRSAAYTLAAPGSAVGNLLRATGEMLRLPYLAVERSTGVLAAYGEPTGSVQHWPLIHDGQLVGELVATPRWGHHAFSAPDSEVLATLGELIGSAVHAEALTADLIDARHRLVTAREEERRRLRHDLHDGLGPLLTGLGLNLDAVAADLHRADGQPESYLTNARAASSEVISTVRALVQGLRPPALDELGFATALRVQTARIAADAGLALTVEVPEDLDLPAAVEVAAFRTAVEAATNTARHGRASRLDVSLQRRNGTLVVEVADDGRSDGPWAPGVGLTGMRERAEELGGNLVAGPFPDGGRVLATLPVMVTSERPVSETPRRITP